MAACLASHTAVKARYQTLVGAVAVVTVAAWEGQGAQQQIAFAATVTRATVASWLTLQPPGSP